MRCIPLLVAAAVTGAEPLAANDICYRFCEDGSKPMVMRRKDCPAGTACRTTLPPDEAAFDTCAAPDVYTGCSFASPYHHEAVVTAVIFFPRAARRFLCGACR